MARKIQVQIVGDASSLERAFRKAGQSSNSFAKLMSRTGAIAGGGLLAGIGLAVNAAANFESALNNLQAVSGASDREMQLVSARARALGADLTLPATSARDAADAMTELAKGGLAMRDTLGAAKAVLQLAAAANIDNAEAATITARALKAFGLGGSEAIRVADVLANAANASTGEITDFAMGLQQASAVAKSWGLSINETTAALMQLADAGIVGSDAGTSLKTFLSRLAPPTKKAQKLMERLGISVFDSSGKFVGISKAIKAYNRGLKGLSQEERKTTMMTLFGSDAIRAANIILGQGAKGLEEYVKKTERSGAAARLAAAKMKGFKGAVEGLKSGIETLGIEFGTGLLPPLTRATRLLNEKLADPKFMRRVRELGQLVGEKLFAALEAIATWFQNNWPEIKEAFRALGRLAERAADAIGKIRDVLKRVAEVTPGGAQTLVGVIVGGILASKLAAAVTQAKFLNKQLLLMLARLGPIVLGLLAIQEISSRLDDEKKLKTHVPNVDVVPGVNLRDIFRFFGAGGSSGGGDKPPATGGAAKHPGKALGGPVIAGQSYMVGERGPELFTPRVSGTVFPGGGGGMSIGVVNVYGVQNVRELIAEIERVAGFSVSQSRGRFAGQTLAIN